jgi:hypothetical protein
MNSDFNLDPFKKPYNINPNRLQSEDNQNLNEGKSSNFWDFLEENKKVLTENKINAYKNQAYDTKKITDIFSTTKENTTTETQNSLMHYYSEIIKVIAIYCRFVKFPSSRNGPKNKLAKDSWEIICKKIKEKLPSLANISEYTIEKRWRCFAKKFEYNEMLILGEIIKQQNESTDKETKSNLENKFNQMLQNLIKTKKLVLASFSEKNSSKATVEINNDNLAFTFSASERSEVQPQNKKTKTDIEIMTDFQDPFSYIENPINNAFQNPSENLKNTVNDYYSQQNELNKLQVEEQIKRYKYEEMVEKHIRDWQDYNIKNFGSAMPLLDQNSIDPFVKLPNSRSSHF